VRLTAEGKTLALKIVRAHRLWEAYLVEALGFPWDEAHIEAERLEHVLSDRLAARLDEVLGYPTVDPHGHPIPSRDGRVRPVNGLPLGELRQGEVATVVQIREDTPELLRYLGDLGIYPGEQITVLEVAPFNGPYRVSVSGETRVIGREVASHVMASPTVVSEGEGKQ
jgi:DtxR family Mn-dependent transcriptional regulator